MKKIVSALLLVFVLLLSSCFKSDDAKEDAIVDSNSVESEKVI
jgi:protein involved in sex pheromone biosynthesis